MSTSQEKLFTEFPPVSREEWEDVITRDLKGADRARKLVWKTYEGIDLEPYYRQEDLENLTWLTQNLPGEFPYVRSNDRSANQWVIRQDIVEPDLTQANAQAKQSLERGAEGVGFVSRVEDSVLKGVLIQSAADLAKVLDGIDLTQAHLFFDFGNRTPELVGWLKDYCADKGIDASAIKGSFDWDPVGELARAGKGKSAESMATSIQETAKVVSASFPMMRLLRASAKSYHMGGANLVQDMAAVLSAGAFYWQSLLDGGMETAEIRKRVGFGFQVASPFFMEVGRLRAFRALWSEVALAFGASEEDCKADVHCETSLFNKTVFDPNVNMLRTTTEAMSAILGGCSSLNVQPYDIVFKNPDAFSYRIARNTQIILKGESYLDKFVDPTGGSYYVENITDKLATEALKKFQDFEAAGGIIAVLQKGDFQKEILELANTRKKNISSRKDAVLGTNQFPNAEEKMLPKIQAPATVEVTDIEANEIQVEAIVAERGAAVFENMRIRTEKSGTTPRVFLWTTGNATMRKARATFAYSFFGCAGFEVQDNLGFNSVEEGMKAVKEYDPSIVVLCSSDDEYPQVAPDIFAALKDWKADAIRVVAGYPKDSIDALKEAGADDFIHVKTNAVDALSSYQDKLGV